MWRRLSPPGDCTRPSVERPQDEQQEWQGGGSHRVDISCKLTPLYLAL